MREIPAITIRHRRENVFSVGRCLERDLCDTWKVCADRIRVLGVRRTEFVKINLLIEIQISLRPLTFPGKARVINSAAIQPLIRIFYSYVVVLGRDRFPWRLWCWLGSGQLT